MTWDKPGMAQQVDQYWRNSPDERDYRARLAALVHEQMRLDSDILLEVGCGTGLVYQALRAELLDHHPYYVGIDSSERMLAIARKRTKAPAAFYTGEAEALHYPDDEFDIAFAFEVFGHMENCVIALGELLRVAKKTAIFTLWLKDGLKAPLLGQDHYEYPPEFVPQAVALLMAGDYEIERREMPHTHAYIVRKVQP